MGHELYPRICNGLVDLKQLLIARFGITLWGLFALSFAFKAAELAPEGEGVPYGQAVSSSLMLVYIAKFYWWERWYMHAADIQVDRLGFMMCWGPLCFMPLVHTLQNLFLVSRGGLQLSRGGAVLYLLLGNAKTLVNYDADTQRHRACLGRQVPRLGKPCQGAPRRILDRGRSAAHRSTLMQRLSGLSHATSIICQISSTSSRIVRRLASRVLPHLYFIYLTALLVDRTYRIDARCHAKYGKHGEAYCKMVPYRLIPGVW